MSDPTEPATPAKPKRPQQVYTLVVQVGRKADDGLPAAATVCPDSRVALCGGFVAGAGFGRIEGALRSAQALAGRLLALVLLLCLALGSPATASAAAASTSTSTSTSIPFRCDGDLLLATADNGAVDAPGIPNSVAGTVPGATVLLEWRGLRLQLPRTNNAGAPSYTDGIWWWSLEDPAQPRFLHRRGATGPEAPVKELEDVRQL